MDHLTNRKARCAYGCGKEEPSSPKLWMFEYLGEGSRHATETCGHCGYHKCAHERQPKNVDPSSVIERGLCAGFEPRGDVGHDSYYCGCHGTD